MAIFILVLGVLLLWAPCSYRDGGILASSLRQCEIFHLSAHFISNFFIY